MLLIPYLVIHLVLRKLYTAVWKVIFGLVFIIKIVKKRFIKPPKQSLHNCNRWGSRCTKFNCKRKQWDYWIWKLLGWENTTWTHTCSAFCLPHCGSNEWKCSLEILIYNYKQAARIVKYWVISLVIPVGIHYCNRFRPDCKRVGCPRYTTNGGTLSHIT
jgi:hypothetical protein